MKKQKFVTEKLGGYWHEDDPDREDFCTCGNDIMNTGYCPNLDLTTPDGTSWIYKQLKNKGTLPKMLDGVWDDWLRKDIHHSQAVYYANILLNQTNFLNAVAEFLGYEEE